MKTIYAFAAIAAFTTAPLAAQTLGNAPVTEADLRGHIAWLADDAREGRFPGTPGETATAHYIARHLSAAGFVGGAADGSWYQPVPLVEYYNSHGSMSVRDAEGRAVALPELAVRSPVGRGIASGAQMVFVGHGVDAAGQVVADVRGKVAVMLSAPRPGENPMSGADRRAALARAGAAAIVILPPANFPFEAFSRQFLGRTMQLAARAGTAPAEVLVSADGGAALLRAGGVDPERASEMAAAEGFTAAPLALTADVEAETFVRRYTSYNVVGRLPGRVADSGAVMLMGHWDHTGLCRPEGAEDRICNGAVDNASGIAVILEAAERLGAGDRPDRDIIVIATTAEEQGLLGAYHWADHPTVPLDRIVVNLNIDTVAIAPRGTPVAIVGRGTVPGLESGVDSVARSLGRTVDSDEEGNAFIRRQDGWALTAKGVASIMAGGSFSDMALLNAFLSGPYHAPDDELTDAVPLGGAADDADLHVALARHFGSRAIYPRP
jgi:hypothetical protein